MMQPAAACACGLPHTPGATLPPAGRRVPVRQVAPARRARASIHGLVRRRERESARTLGFIEEEEEGEDGEWVGTMAAVRDLAGGVRACEGVGHRWGGVDG